MTTTFTVMTFNIRGALHDDGVNAWPQRADLNVATIRRCDPDLIGLQEAQLDNLAVYEGAFPAYERELGPQAIRQDERREHLPILWKADRFEKVDQGGFYLSETPETWSPGWGARLVRAVNWVELRCKQSGQHFVHLNTHFDHEHDLARIGSARLIMERLPAIRRNLPALLTGDFNALPGSDPYDILVDAGGVDTFAAVEHDEGPRPTTFNGFNTRSFPTEGLRIDWILTYDGAQRWQTRSYEIITDAQPPLFPSDHYPVLVALSLE